MIFMIFCVFIWWYFWSFSVLFSVFFFRVFFFVPFIVHFFVLSRVFFRALGGTQDKQPQYFAFWPVRFLVLFLVVTTSEDRIYTYIHNLCGYIWVRSPASRDPGDPNFPRPMRLTWYFLDVPRWKLRGMGRLGVPAPTMGDCYLGIP